MIVERKSPLTGIVHVRDINCTVEAMKEFMSHGRRLIQDIFPDLTPDEREFIKTGITAEEWKELFADSEE